MATWRDKVASWEAGIPQTYPPSIKKGFGFFYETMWCDKDMANPYVEKFIESHEFKGLTQDYTAFKDYVAHPETPFVTSFYNPPGDTLLIIPTPLPPPPPPPSPIEARQSRSKGAKSTPNFTTMKDFIDYAPEEQQIAFWKYVAKKLRMMLDDPQNQKHVIYVSTHGLGVPYFHLRLARIPRYYHTKKFLTPSDKQWAMAAEARYKAAMAQEKAEKAKTKGQTRKSTLGGRKSLDACTVAELKERATKRNIKVNGLKKLRS